MEQLTRDGLDAAVQGFAVTPDKCFEPATIAAGATHTVNAQDEELLAVRFRASNDVDVYVNGLTACVMMFDGGVQHELLLSSFVTSISFVNSSAAPIMLQLWGM